MRKEVPFEWYQHEAGCKMTLVKSLESKVYRRQSITVLA